MTGPGDVFVREFCTFFDDDTVLTTTSLPSSPFRAPWFRTACHPELEVDALYARHRAGIEARRERGAAPVPVAGTLLDLAESIDGYLARLGL